MTSGSFSLIETSLIKGKWDSKIPESLSPATNLAKLTVECRFEDVLKSQNVRLLCRLLPENTDASIQELLDLSVKLGEDPVEEELTRLTIAVACLHTFVQANWTGPDLDINPIELWIKQPDYTGPWTEDLLHEKAISELAYRGEPAYHLAQVPVFLRLSRILLEQNYEHVQSIMWWRLRALMVHQRILDEPAPFSENLPSLLEPLISTLASEPDLVGQMYLELGLLDHTLSQDKTAGEFFIKASRSTGLEYELSGALGRRTKFQVNEVSQLVLLAESRLKENGPQRNGEPLKQASNSDVDAKNVPTSLALNDDTLLEQTEFTSSRPAGQNSKLSHIDPAAQPSLHPIDQCILLSLCLNVRNTSPLHGLTAEQMSPYISRVISHPNNWSVHTMALLLRSRLESSRTRTVERSTFQLQALIDQMPTSDSSISERLLYFHLIPLPSRWEMEKELALRYLSLGVVKSALEIFERLEMWEEVVQCYSALEKPEKGIGIVRDLLEGRKEEAGAVISRGKSTSQPRKKLRDITREAKLWCLLGDLDPVNAVEHYERAWNLSMKTSGRSMRSLGGYYFSRGNFRDAITCLKRAVKLNPLLTRSWFILGCACMRVEEWEDAKVAFSRCVAIDEEDGESWNNLASMYLRIGTTHRSAEEEDSSVPPSPITKNGDGMSSEQSNIQMKTIPFENRLLAFRALKQGLRSSYENWRMWYNYMIVAMDVGELQEACRALGRIVEQTDGKAAVDEDVLDRLVDAVTRAPSDREEAAREGNAQNPNEGHGLFKNVQDLFQRTLLTRLSSPRIFRAYGRLLSWQGKWEESIKAYLDAYRCSTAGTIGKGEVDTTKWQEAVSEVEEMVDILRNFGPRVDGKNWRLQGRSIVRTFIGRMRDFEDQPEWSRLAELQDELCKDD